MRRMLLRLILSLSLIFSLTACSHLESRVPSETPRVPASAPVYQLATSEYLKELSSRITRVPEFADLAKYGAEHGLRIWGAGGTAAGIAHYVKQDLKREWLKEHKLPPEFYDSKFGYSYYDIYRSTQDADIIIDGTEKDAVALESYLQRKFNYLQGSKSVWEVRLLRQSRGSGVGKKEALLGDLNFRNQNTDTHSTGMVELTDPPKSESRIRDLFDWENQKSPKFLEDVLTGKLHYYANPAHRKTARYLAGWNPEILSVIRYFTKAFQYGLDLNEEDTRVIQRIINDFDPDSDEFSNLQIQRYISSNSLKLLGHAENIERGSEIIRSNGLRKKLLEYAANYELEEMETALSRSPLRSFPIGKGPGVPGKVGTGKTAAELGITEVAHETNSFSAYESITMSRLGKPNVYRSRAGQAQEAALYGDGFYTRIGKIGARGTGVTIRFRVAPKAVDGLDFYLVPESDYVVLANGAALQVIDESIELNLGDYFRFIIANDTSNDRGFMEKLKLRLKSKSSILTSEQRKKYSQMIEETLINPKNPRSAPIHALRELATYGVRLSPEGVIKLFLQGSLDDAYFPTDRHPDIHEVLGTNIRKVLSVTSKLLNERLREPRDWSPLQSGIASNWVRDGAEIDPKAVAIAIGNGSIEEDRERTEYGILAQITEERFQTFVSASKLSLNTHEVELKKALESRLVSSNPWPVTTLRYFEKLMSEGLRPSKTAMKKALELGTIRDIPFEIRLKSLLKQRTAKDSLEENRLNQLLMGSKAWTAETLNEVNQLLSKNVIPDSLIFEESLSHPNFIRGSLPGFFDTFMKIQRATGVDANTRPLALKNSVIHFFENERDTQTDKNSEMRKFIKSLLLDKKISSDQSIVYAYASTERNAPRLYDTAFAKNIFEKLGLWTIHHLDLLPELLKREAYHLTAITLKASTSYSGAPLNDKENPTALNFRTEKLGDFFNQLALKSDAGNHSPSLFELGFWARPEIVEMKPRESTRYLIAALADEKSDRRFEISEMIHASGILNTPDFSDQWGEIVERAKNGSPAEQSKVRNIALALLSHQVPDGISERSLSEALRLMEIDDILYDSSGIQILEHSNAPKYTRDAAHHHLEALKNKLTILPKDDIVARKFITFALSELTSPIMMDFPEWDDLVIGLLKTAKTRKFSVNLLHPEADQNIDFIQNPVGFLSEKNMKSEPKKWKNLYLRIRDEVGFYDPTDSLTARLFPNKAKKQYLAAKQAVEAFSREAGVAELPLFRKCAEYVRSRRN